VIWLALLAGCALPPLDSADTAGPGPIETCGDGTCSQADAEDPQSCPWDCGFTTLLISDLGGDNAGGTPGVDLDAVSVQHDGQTVWATEVVDASIRGPDNAWTDVTEALGPSDSECLQQHFVSLGGHDAWIALGFGVPIRAGDTVTTYELSDDMCADGSKNDIYDVLLSNTASVLDGQWIGIAAGKSVIEVPPF